MSRGAASGSFWRRHRIKFVVSLLIGAASVWLLKAGALPVLPSRSAFVELRWWTVPAYLVIWSAVHVLRAARWWWLLSPIARVPMRKVLSVSFIGFAAIQLLPFRTGEVVRPVMIREQGRLSGWAATGTIAAERIIDGLVLSIVLFLALTWAAPLEPLPERIGELPIPVSLVPRAAYAALALFAVAFVTMAVFYWRREFARRVTLAIVGVVSRSFATWLADRVGGVADGLRFLRDWRYAGPFTAITLGYWLLNAAASWLLAWGVGFHDITFAQACVNTGVLALGILLPNAPGYFGAFQFSVYAAFAMYFPAQQVQGAGSAFVFLLYLLQLVITLGGAAGALWFQGGGIKSALNTEAAALDG